MKKQLFAVIGTAATALLLSTSAFADTFHWAGDVNRGVKVSIHRDQVHLDTPKTGSTTNVHSDFHGRLRERTRRVRLVDSSGRGRVRLSQQPSESNDYTAVVTISEKDAPGAGHYEFTLEWR